MTQEELVTAFEDYLPNEDIAKLVDLVPYLNSAFEILIKVDRHLTTTRYWRKASANICTILGADFDE